jgi:hypothetical protein
LFDEYPELKDRKIYFLLKGGLINRSDTIIENNIKDGDTILINYYEDEE